MTTYQRTLPSLLESTLATVPQTITILDYTNNNNGTHTIEVCDPLYAEPLRMVDVGGNDYEITSIDYDNNTILLTGTPVISVNSFTLYPPRFFVESPISLNAKLIKLTDEGDKVPMMYLLVNYRERNNSDTENLIEREVDMTLYFLTKADFGRWLTGDFYTNAIVPMHRLRELFVDALKADRRNYDMIDADFNVNPVKNFGVYINTKGVPDSWCNDDLSGEQMEITLKLKRQDPSCPC